MTGRPGMRWRSRRCSTGSSRTCAATSATTCSTSPPSNPSGGSPPMSTSRCAAPCPAPSCAACSPPPTTRSGGPSTTTVKYDGDELPVWDEATGNYLDPATGEVLPTWDQALDAIGDEDEPWHVARFGDRFDAQGVLSGSKDAGAVHRLPDQVPHQAGGRLPPGRRPTPSSAHAARLAEALRYPAVLAAVRELAPLRHPAQERPARPGPRLLQGQGPRRRSPRLRRAPGPGLPQVVRQDPGRPPGRPPELAAGHARCFGNRPGPVRLGTRRARPTRTTWSTPGGSCTPSLTAPDGKPRSPRPDAGPPSSRPAIFRQPGGRHDERGRRNDSGRLLTVEAAAEH